MNFEKVPNQAEAGKDKETENIEQNVLKVGEREYHTGDAATVTRSNGTREDDWTVKAFNDKLVFLEKIGKEGPLHKILTVEKFRDQQTAQEKTENG